MSYTLDNKFQDAMYLCVSFLNSYPGLLASRQEGPFSVARVVADKLLSNVGTAF